MVIPTTFDAPTPLLRVYRGALLEKEHLGSVAVVNAAGAVLYCAGNPCTVTFPRSAIKFIQALPLLMHEGHEALGLTDEEVALTCASHSSERVHVEVARSILGKAGVSECCLQCGGHESLNKDTRDDYIRCGEKMTTIHSNCSGKHSGFLALSKLLGAPLETYLERSHPVQRLVTTCVTELCDVEEDEIVEGIDGCSAPQFGIPVAALATGFARMGDAMSNPDGPYGKYSVAATRVFRSLRTHPYMLAGNERFCTDLIRITNGECIGKIGADGVYAVLVPKQQIAVAVKVSCGSPNVQVQVVVEALAQLGALSEAQLAELGKYHHPPQSNYAGLQVGRTELCFRLQKTNIPFRELWKSLTPIAADECR